MDARRWLRHLVTPDWLVREVFPKPAMTRIEEAIGAAERRHSGQIRFAVEAALHPAALLRGVSARERAIEVFSALRVWDTEGNNGVLIYLLLADRDVEIVADRAIAAKVSAADWQAICWEMENQFKRRDFERALVAGVGAVAALLAQHFPPGERPVDELPNAPVEIR
jgi:uncharacterized membrane protein